MSEVGFEPTIPDIPVLALRKNPNGLTETLEHVRRDPPDLHRMGARGIIGSGALDRSAIPTYKFQLALFVSKFSSLCIYFSFKITSNNYLDFH